MSKKHLAGALALAAITTGGCLPRGDAPAGRQILADRTASLVQMVPPNGDGRVRVLYFKPGKDADHTDLWVLSTDAGGGDPKEQKLSDDFGGDAAISYKPAAQSGSWIGLGFGPSFRTNEAFLTDGHGRIYLSHFNADFTTTTSRVDPATGESLIVGDGEVSFSASGQRGAVGSQSPTAATSPVVLYEADDSTTTVQATNFGFLGEDFYYLTGAGELVRNIPGGYSQVLAMSVTRFLPIAANLILLTRGTPPASPFDPSDAAAPAQPATPPTQATLDLTTLLETPLPAGLPYQQYVSCSWDGRWLLATDGSQQILVDRLTGALEPFDAPWGQAEWRPGHDELWGTAYNPDGTGLDENFIAIKRPGQPLVTIPSAYLYRFTPDGSAWIAPSKPLDQTPSVEVIGLADDPTGPRRPLVPDGNSMIDLWQVDDGRVLVTSETDPNNDFDHYTVQVVDPTNGATIVVGQRGYVAAVGTKHMLGLYNYDFERGDLTTFDYATGARTVLAPEFAVSAVTARVGTDDYPPGGSIAYEYKARFASPWDGLWLVTAP